MEIQEIHSEHQHDVEYNTTSHNLCRSRLYTAKITANHLVAASDPILTLIGTLRFASYPQNKEAFFSNLAHELCAFEHHAKIANYSSHIITDAHYLLCCLLNKIITSTSPWEQNHDYCKYHDEKKIITSINAALNNPVINLHFLELAYICLILGFADANHQNLINKLYQTIIQYRSCDENNDLLVDQPQPITTSPGKPKQSRFITTKILLWSAAISLFLIGDMFMIINYKLNHAAQPIYQTYIHR